MKRNRGRLASIALAVAMSGIAVLACRQIVGIDDQPTPHGDAPAIDASTDTGASMCGATYGQGDCAACVATSCCSEGAACTASPTCSALEGCMSRCNGDATCRAQCGADHGLGNDTATPAFEACVAKSCQSACGLTCGGLAAVFPPATATACDSCVVQNACAEMGDCAKDVHCQTALRCQFAGGAPDVVQACGGLSADAGPRQLLDGRTPPLAKVCAKECSWGADWSCVGKVKWQPVRFDPLTVTMDIFDGLTVTKDPNATVKLCSSGDPGCVNALASGQTDDGGTATLSRSAISAPVDMYIEATSPSFIQLDEFVTAPFSQSHVSLPAPTLTASNLLLLAQFLDETSDSTLGNVALVAVDCRLGIAPGVSFALDPPGASRLAYVKGVGFDPTATETDSSGNAAFLNTPVLPIALTITMTPKALGRAAATSKVFARPHGETTVYVLPTP